METVTVSSKYQVVIPSKLRQSLDIKAGQKLMMIEYQGQIRMIPVIPIHEARGRYPGLDTTVEREREDRV